MVGQVGLEPTQDKPAHLQCAAIATRRLTRKKGAGWNRTNVTRIFARTRPLSYGSICGDAYGVRTHIASLRGWCPERLDEGTIVVIRAGLELRIAALKGLCTDHLDERTI